MLLHRGVNPPNKCPGYDIKQCDGEGSSIAGAFGNPKYSLIYYPVDSLDQRKVTGPMKD